MFEKMGAGERRARLLARVKQIKLLRSWQLTLILIPLLFVVATGLRFDHLEAKRLVEAVKKADLEANEAELAENLVKLKKFVQKNIVVNIREENGATQVDFGTGPFYLEHQYVRKATEELKKAEQRLASSSGQQNIYAEASAVCQPIAIRNGWAWNSKGYIDCMMGELAKHPAQSEINDLFQVMLPSTQIYRLNYASPVWAPSLTGWLMVLCVVIFLVIMARVAFWLILRVVLLGMRRK